MALLFMVSRSKLNYHFDMAKYFGNFFKKKTRLWDWRAFTDGNQVEPRKKPE